MQDILIVVDMQNDFIDGALGTPEAAAIVPRVSEKIRNFCGKVIFTRDTHEDNYMDTQEGKNLPIPHCIKETKGWQISSDVMEFCKNDPINKETFGSVDLGFFLREEYQKNPIQTVTLIGLCTDICVISNALLIKAFLPEVKIIVDASCCAGVTPESHRNALEAMKICQIVIENEE